MSRPIIIRPAELAEREGLIALQRRASLANGGDRKMLQQKPDAIDIPVEHFHGNAVTVAVQHATTVGFCVVLQQDDADLVLDGLFVEPQHWRQGIGCSLLKHVIENAIQSNIAAVHVLANPHALSFYQSIGFEQIRIEQTAFGPGYLMQYPIKHSANR